MKNSLSTFSAPGFFASMLRRLLFCSNSLPPLNHSCAAAAADDDNLYAMSAPCLVARLMGLDSLPPPPAGADTASSRSSITKSWSMNSSQRSLSGEKRESGQVRLREEPNYAELEDEHFFILSFEKKFRSKKDDRSNVGFGKLKPRNQERWKVYPNSKENRNPNEDPYESAKRRGKKKSNSDRSPVSVLDVDELATTSSDLSTPVNETEEIEVSKNFKLLLTSPRTNLLISSIYNNNNNNNNNRMPFSKWCKNRKMWNEIRRISEKEMAGSRWDIYGEASKLQEFEEIGDCIAEILLRELLEEMR